MTGRDLAVVALAAVMFIGIWSLWRASIYTECRGSGRSVPYCLFVSGQ
jgi:hypothetical protein